LLIRPCLATAVLAAAILDRVLHHAVTVNIRGNSYRLKDKLKSGIGRAATKAVSPQGREFSMPADGESCVIVDRPLTVCR